MELGIKHIAQVAVGTWRSAVLYTLAELEIADTLAAGPLTAAEVAGCLELDAVATKGLLNAAVTIRLLSNDDRTSPPFDALHHLSSIVLWDGGGDLTVTEASDLLRDVGFSDATVASIGGNSSTVLVAAKPVS